MTVVQAKRVCLFSLPARPGGWGCDRMPRAVRSFGDWLDGKLATPYHVRNLLIELLGCTGELDAMVYVAEAHWIGVVVEKDGGPERGGSTESWRVLDFTPATAPAACCRRCGCTEDLGCVEGCTWVEPDLCSQCV